jgi:hypothetical protein
LSLTMGLNLRGYSIGSIKRMLRDQRYVYFNVFHFAPSPCMIDTPGAYVLDKKADS